MESIFHKACSKVLSEVTYWTLFLNDIIKSSMSGIKMSFVIWISGTSEMVSRSRGGHSLNTTMRVRISHFLKPHAGRICVFSVYSQTPVKPHICTVLYSWERLIFMALVFQINHFIPLVSSYSILSGVQIIWDNCIWFFFCVSVVYLQYVWFSWHVC